MSFSRQFCTFYLERLLFGVELQKVQEVLRYLELTDVPLAPQVVSGREALLGVVGDLFSAARAISSDWLNSRCRCLLL